MRAALSKAGSAAEGAASKGAARPAESTLGNQQERARPAKGNPPAAEAGEVRPEHPQGKYGSGHRMGGGASQLSARASRLRISLSPLSESSPKSSLQYILATFSAIQRQARRTGERSPCRRDGRARLLLRRRGFSAGSPGLLDDTRLDPLADVRQHLLASQIGEKVMVMAL